MRKIGAFLLLLFVIFSCGKSGNNDKRLTGCNE